MVDQKPYFRDDKIKLMRGQNELRSCLGYGGNSWRYYCKNKNWSFWGAFIVLLVFLPFVLILMVLKTLTLEDDIKARKAGTVAAQLAVDNSKTYPDCAEVVKKPPRFINISSHQFNDVTASELSIAPHPALQTQQ
ncbi:MAG: hypothetical protein OSA23_09675 [Rhodospirillales bacterium]|nr:hypothetical protein [Rhodospirillales bacterium]